MEGATIFWHCSPVSEGLDIYIRYINSIISHDISGTMVSGSPKNDPDIDEDKRDFEILKRQLVRSASSISSLSSTSSNHRLSSPIDSETSNEIWPLKLHTTFIDHYIVGDVIGSGSYAEVRECINTLTLERSAVKIVNRDYLKRQAPNALCNQLQEIKLLRKFNHPNIIAMKECLSKESRLFLVLEYCTFNLHDLLIEPSSQHKNKPDEMDDNFGLNKLCPSIARTLFRQLCLGLEYMQSFGVVHRDIKPQNLLINNCGILKIIDFGVSHVLNSWSKPDSCSNYEGSPLFQAPEVISGQSHYDGFKVDIWSAGVTLHLMVHGRYPFMDTSLLNLYDKILSQDFEPPKEQSSRRGKVLNNLLSRMLDKLSSRRASIAEVLDHPWLSLNQSYCIDDDGEQSDLHDLLFALTHQASLVSTMHQSQTFQHSQHDIYRSMTVLPYLYNHHFPNAPIIKAQSRGSSQSKDESMFSGTILSRTYGHKETEQLGRAASAASNASAASSTSSGTLDGSSITSNDGSTGASTNAASKGESSTSSSVPDPHRVLTDEDDPIEWGTETQYRLLKVPQIRANRIGYNRRSGRLRRRKKPTSVQSSNQTSDSGQNRDVDYNSVGSDSSDD